MKRFGSRKKNRAMWARMLHFGLEIPIIFSGCVKRERESLRTSIKKEGRA